MSEPGFRDYFSAVSGGYRRFRPRYPPALFRLLASLSCGRRLAWDCGCGSGQVARSLAPRFDVVVATDASAAQLARALWHPRVAYRLAPAEAAPLADASVDLVTVAQALHWFDQPRFFAEVRRVLRPGGIIALWSYGLVRVSPAVDVLVDRLYDEVLGAYWPAERASIDAGLAGLPMPFAGLAVPRFTMTAGWTREQLLGYLGTWSAVARFREATAGDPLSGFAEALSRCWPDASERREIRWPLHLRVGANTD